MSLLPSATYAGTTEPLWAAAGSGGGGGGGVSRILAGTNIDIFPNSGVGEVTINGSAGVTSVTGTLNEITATTTGSAVTLTLASPSPAPTPGTYISPQLTVDALGRITAITDAGAVDLVTTFLPATVLGDSSVATDTLIGTISGLTVGRPYNCQINLALAVSGAITGWTAGGAYLFRFNGAGSTTGLPEIYPGGAQTSLVYFEVVQGSTLQSLGTADGGRFLTVTFSAVIIPTATSVTLHAIFQNGPAASAITPSGAMSIASKLSPAAETATGSYVQIQAL